MSSSLITGRISSKFADLNELNKNYPWIPNEHTIRPSESVLLYKRCVMAEVESQWETIKDYIYYDVYDLPYVTDTHTGLNRVVATPSSRNTWAFVPSKFPYDLSHGGNHSVLWNSEQPYAYEYDDFIVNMAIDTSLQSQLGHTQFQFVWYKNPKPTVPHVWHVQVFWKNTSNAA